MQLKMSGASPVCYISREVTFQAAHALPKTPPGHKCRKVHGHSYTVRVTIKGPVREDGFVVDNAEIDALLKYVHNTLDHTCLNDAHGELGKNPTAEWICVWVWRVFDLTDLRQMLHKVEVYEGPNSRFAFCGEHRKEEGPR